MECRRRLDERGWREEPFCDPERRAEMRGVIAGIGLVIAGGLGVRIVFGDLSGEASAIGLVVALLCLVGVVLSLPRPSIAALLFVVAGVLGLLAAVAAHEFVVWGSVVLLLGPGAHVAAHAKRRTDDQEAEVDAWIRRQVSAMAPDGKRGRMPR
jgi:hypothetical protein